RRADSFSPIRWRGGGDRPHHRGRPAAAELGGLLRQQIGRASCREGLLAALALRFGGSAAGADRSAEIGRANSLDHRLARASMERAERATPPPAPRRFFFTYSLAGWRRSTAPSRSTGRCRARGSSST